MTSNKQTTTTTTTTHRSSSVTMSWFMNILAFAAVCIGGIALFLAMILNVVGLTASWISSMQAIANAIGWLALCLLSMRYIVRRRKLSVWIIWGIAVFMIVSGTIVPLFK